MYRKLIILISALLCAWSASGQTTVYLDKSDKGWTVPASINGVSVKTYYAPSNWYLSLSSNTYLFLYENGYIEDADVLGMTVMKLSDGSTAKAASFVIKDLKIANLRIHDIPAVVLKNQSVPFLIGNTAFESLGEVSYEEGAITVDWSDDKALAEEKGRLSETDSLKVAAQNYIDSQDYASASSCLERLYKNGELNMFSHYQYCMVLGLTGQFEKELPVAKDWIREYRGKSLYMDWYVLRGLGGSCLALRDNAGAISWYTDAMEAYYRLYNTSEKAIESGSFHDEKAGPALLGIGQAYAAQGKVAKCEKYCVLAAKCGYEPAKEFCRKYGMKY